MRQKVQVTFDCADPAKLAAFYAQALRYKLQRPPAEFGSWEEAFEAWGIPEEEREVWSAIVDPDGTGPRVFFQKMGTTKPGKNRLHLDINASSGVQAPLEQRKEEVGARVRELVAAGAKEQSKWEEDDEYWVVMLDPEGNEFCVQ